MSRHRLLVVEILSILFSPGSLQYCLKLAGNFVTWKASRLLVDYFVIKSIQSLPPSSDQTIEGGRAGDVVSYPLVEGDIRPPECKTLRASQTFRFHSYDYARLVECISRSPSCSKGEPVFFGVVLVVVVDVSRNAGCPRAFAIVVR